jgi:hypothetical protein
MARLCFAAPLETRHKALPAPTRLAAPLETRHKALLAQARFASMEQ